MRTPKDAKGVSPALQETPLAQSKLWHTPIDKIVPAQLVAYIAKQAMQGGKSRRMQQ